MKKIFNREFILYGIFGIITSLLNVGLFYILLKVGLEYALANLLNLIIVKVIAYILNKNYVFKSKCNNIRELIFEFMRFIFYRGITLLVDYFGLIILVECFFVDKMIAKVMITIIVIIINYFTGKKYVFKKVAN